jgi:hypothetical protein
MIEFEENLWRRRVQKPTWYLDYVQFINQAKTELGEKTQELDSLNKKVRHFFEEALPQDKICLASEGPDLDKERLPVDTIVVHHTSAEPGYRLSYLNATHMLNIYAPYFANPTIDGEKDLKGKALWSGHFKDGKPVFWGYHWLMRMDGTFERLLEDNQLGWHAGNWEINRRSVAICLDNSYDKQDPADDILQKLAAHIKAHYPNIGLQNIIGHREARQGTTCPGAHFLDGWKPVLQDYLAKL